MLGGIVHRIEVTLPEGPMGLALDRLSGNVITRVKEDSPSDMVGIVSGCMLQEINGADTTVLNYEETLTALREASKPVKLTLKTKVLLEAKPEENVEGLPPTTLLQSKIPGKNEFEVKMRGITRDQMFVIKSGNDFIVKEVMKEGLPEKKGIHPMDEIVGINGMNCVVSKKRRKQ